MTRQKALEILRELRFSAGLSDEDMGKIADVSQVVDYPAGTTIFVEGGTNCNFYLLRSGHVELSMRVHPRGCLPILTLGEGDLLGWSPMLGTGQMTTTAIAIADTQLIRISTNQLHLLCEQDHDIGYEIMRRIAVALLQRLIATRLQVLDMYDHTPQGSPNCLPERQQ